MALHYAIRNRLLSEVRSLVENGADVNARDRDSRSPLMMCCFDSDEDWAAGVARMLLQAGARVGIEDKDGRNSLMFGSVFERKQLIDLFLKAVDFDLHKADCTGNTALHFAALAGNETITSKLLSAMLQLGLDINVRNMLGQTPAALALHLGNVSCVELFRYGYGNAMADFSTKVPHALLLRPWNKEVRYIQTPDLMLKNAISDALDGAKVHRSRPRLNVHQFRRGAAMPDDVLLKRKKRKRRGNSRNTKEPANPPRKDSMREVVDPHRRLSQTGSINNENSWRAIMPDFMDVLRVQVSPSYRKSAVGVPQSFNEIFDLPPENPTPKQPEAEETNDKPPQNNRRKSIISNGSTRSRAKSELYDVFAFQPAVEGKRRGRKGSAQIADSAQLQRRKTVDKLSAITPESSRSNSSSSTNAESANGVASEPKRRHTLAAGALKKQLAKSDETNCKETVKAESVENEEIHNVAGSEKDEPTEIADREKASNRFLNSKSMSFREMGKALSDIAE